MSMTRRSRFRLVPALGAIALLTRPVLAAGFGVLVLLGSLPAAAGDGVIEINQAAALAGGVVPGDAPGFPVTISQPGSYRLSGPLHHTAEVMFPNDLVVLHITAEDVTLDLNGFRLSGTNTFDGFPEESGVVKPIVAEAENVHVRNGSYGGQVDVGCEARLTGTLSNVLNLTNETIGSGLTICTLNVGKHSSLRAVTVSFAFAESGGLVVGGRGRLLTSDSLVLGQWGDIVRFGGNNGRFGLLLDSVLTDELEVLGDNDVAYGRNVIQGQPAVFGAGTAIELGTNVCGSDTTCP